MNGKIVCLAVMALAASVTLAKTTSKSEKRRGAADSKMAEATSKDIRVTIDQFPRTGRQSTLNPPMLEGESIIGKTYSKPRRWIVLESKYSTYDKWVDQITFTWHVMLDTKSATEKVKNDTIAPYSYFSTSVTYVNIPKGTHSASVCLAPSYLERFGEPKAIGIVVTDPEGKVLAGDTMSEIKGIESHSKFWENEKIMDATDNTTGERIVERRQGLQDRSKTIWAIVNPNDYEFVMQH